MNHRGALPVSFPSGNRMPQRLRRWRLRHAIGAAELAHWWPLSLSRRIVVTVTLGLGFILLLSGVLVEWTIRESTRAAFDDRVRLAQDFAQRVDDVVISAQASIEDESAHLQIDPNQGLTAAAQQRLTELLARDNGFNRVVITDVNGRIWWQGSSPHGALDAPLDPLAAHMALDTRQTQRGLCSSSQSSIAPLVCFAVPLSDSTGATSAVLAAVFDPTAVPTYSLFTAAAFTPTTTDGINVGLFDTAGSSPIPTSGSPSLFGAEHRRLLAPFIGTASAGYAIHRPVSGPMHVVVYAPVPTLPSWGVVLEEPRDHVVTLPDQLRQRLALFGAVVLVLAMGLAWTDVRRVVGPLRHLTAAAEQFAAGHLEQPIRLNRGDELGILAGAFETMRLRLRASLNEVETWNQELEQRVARRTSEVEARNHELASLNALAETVGGSLEPREMLEGTLAHVLAITGADAGYCLMPSGDEGQLRLAAGWPGQPPISGVCPPLPGCACRQAFQENRLVQSCAGDAASGGVLCPLMAFPSRLALPLPAGERVQGVLLLGWAAPPSSLREREATLSAIGRQVGMALANARLYEDLQLRDRERLTLLQRLMNAQEDERRRLAQELHDETSQALASLQFGLERLVTGPESSEAVRVVARELRGVTNQTLADVHRLSVELRPSVLDDIGLPAAVERYLRDFGARYGITVDFAAVGIDQVRLFPAAETAIYRIVQGALTNVAQHAQAGHVSLLLRRRGETFVVVVEDDGRGFDLDAVRAGPLEHQLGLAGMEERAALLGATVTIETAPGMGTTIFVEVPLDLNRSEGRTGDGTAAHSAS